MKLPRFEKHGGYAALMYWNIYMDMRADFDEMTRKYRRFDMLTTATEPYVYAYRIFHKWELTGGRHVDGKWYITPEGETLERESRIILMILCGYDPDGGTISAYNTP